MKKNIHRGGRPPIQREPEFYIKLLDRYETHSIRQLADIYDVSHQTIWNWLQKARKEASKDSGQQQLQK